MRFEVTPLDDRNRFTGYGPGYVEINGERIGGTLIISGSRLDREGLADGLASLTPDAVSSPLDGRPEVVLVGTGDRFRLLPREFLAPLQAVGIGVEVMDTPAACRTFNVLLAEGRKVVAALVVEQA